MTISKLTNNQEEEVISRYTTPLDDGTWIGATTIAIDYGVGSQTIYNILKKHGVETRSAKEAHSNGKRTKPIKNLPIGKTPLCKCGCGKLVSWNQRKNKWNVYVEGHYRPEKPYHSRDWLEREYSDKCRSVNDIAKDFGVGKSVILKFLRKYRIPTRRGGETLALSGKMKGSLNPAWKSGIARDYHKAWKKISREVRLRDSHTCQICHRSQDVFDSKRPLHVHHIDYDKANNEFTNLITLCNECHRSIPEGDPEWRDKLAVLIVDR